jgi:neutral ceramidase
LKKLLFILAAILVLLAFLLQPVSRIPFDQTSHFAEWQQLKKSIEIPTLQTGESWQVGWAKANITPSRPEMLIGYKVRGPQEGVLDSLFLHALYLSAGNSSVAVVNLDLLMVPSSLPSLVNERLKSLGMDVPIYWSATHTHSGFGGWEKGWVNRFITGKFDEKVLIRLSDLVVEAISEAIFTAGPARIQYLQKTAGGMVENRISRDTVNVDNQIRTLIIEREDGSRGIWTSFSAHPTMVHKDIHSFSADYPGALRSKLEASFDFAMFSAGMVGSQRPFEAHDAMQYGAQLAEILLHDMEGVVELNPALGYEKLRIPIPLPSPRLSKNVMLRPWVFKAAMGELNADVDVLRLGSLVLMSVPADFAGELAVHYSFNEAAKSSGLQLMITGFNGSYVGYLTASKHFDTSDKEEIRTLNWLGYQSGDYVARVVLDLLKLHSLVEIHEQ